MGETYLHFRSNYSLLRGCRSPEEICHFARERNISTVGMADINNFYGLISFLLAAGREGVRPVVGVVVEQGGRPLFTACVMNREGYSRICRVLTELLTDSAGTYDPVATLCDRGWEGLSLLSPNPDVVQRLAGREKQGVYVQLFYGRPFSALAGFAREKGVPVAATLDTVFLRESDQRLYPMLRAIDLNTTVERVPTEELLGANAPPAAQHAFVEPADMKRFFSAVPDALSNTEAIAREADASGIISPRFIFPA
ncbi:MAG TPA: PHP domain-containing protein, partial [Spirochaetia bacterium]|nr:PHP domain-containing protein [Spirochaetia bacterium]